ncbi:Protein IDA-LIKE [Quillaja saponaria]|uniref:Protein IDA-LIKE n=1 Tax=Quillaja saponaria TaxID=32244 RepID=A0AAD7P5V8_QUISA|nr:Protein IDA-LIKE [Quillaja saponaria]
MAAASYKILCTYIVLLLILILSIGSCTATRPGTSMMMISEKVSLNSHDQTKFHRRKHGSSYKDMVFNLLPKGTQVPPSGPSKRHNSVVNSTPLN